MRWEKLGRVYVPDGSATWAQTHAYVPTAYVRDAETIRVFASFLDADRIGRIGYVDVESADPRRVIGVSATPVLDVGAAGTFDEHGVTPVGIVESGKRVLLYYMGWQRRDDMPYAIFAGVAASSDGGQTFRRFLDRPVLPPGPSERVLRSACTVQPGEVWRAWYVSGDAWTTVDGKAEPVYEIRRAESRDGIEWSAPGVVAVERKSDDEYGLGRPFLRETIDGLELWYSVRSRAAGYRIGVARSSGGESWERCDEEAGIDVSPTGWDSEMICFACIHAVGDETYMFYNGNSYGATGFGVARLLR